jgi:hypothetical protein
MDVLHSGLIDLATHPIDLGLPPGLSRELLEVGIHGPLDERSGGTAVVSTGSKPCPASRDKPLPPPNALRRVDRGVVGSVALPDPRHDARPVRQPRADPRDDHQAHRHLPALPARRLEYCCGSGRYILEVGDVLQFVGEVAHDPGELISLPIQFLAVKSLSAAR